MKRIANCIRETLQTLPVIGTLITNYKEDSDKNPKGQIKLSSWDWYRLVLGLGVGYVLYKGLLNLNEIKSILALMGL